jgi:hypothetical protein
MNVTPQHTSGSRFEAGPAGFTTLPPRAIYEELHFHARDSRGRVQCLYFYFATSMSRERYFLLIPRLSVLRIIVRRHPTVHETYYKFESLFYNTSFLYYKITKQYFKIYYIAYSITKLFLHI